MAATIVPNDPTFSESREVIGRTLLPMIDNMVAPSLRKQKLLR
jgi:hypothetical protein